MLIRLGGAACLLALAAAGCTMKTDGASSSLTINHPFAVPGAASVAPPPFVPAPAGPPPAGTFAGTGRLSNSTGSGCRIEIRVDGMVVAGNRVRWRGFRGTIPTNGFVELQAGRAFLYGVFNGPQFTGHLWEPHPACTYDLVLNHVG